MYKQSQYEIITQFHKLRIELGRDPRPDELFNSIVGGRRHILQYFKSYDELKAAVDAPPIQNGKILSANGDISEKLIISPEQAERDDEKLRKKYNRLCSTTGKLHSFNVHTLDIEELFAKAGNPPSLKMSGMPDTHVKFRDKAAVKSYLKFLDFYRPHVHLIFGDFADCEGISHWPQKDLEPRRLIPEMVEARDLLGEIVAATPDCSSRIFLEGNHEDWINQAFARMPELFDGMEEYLDIDISVKALLNLEKFNYDFFPVNDLVQIGRAYYTHGIYTSQHHAKKHLDTFKCNIYYGHLHDTQSTNATSIYGPIEAASQGCLSRLDAKFLKGKPNNWQHGHGVWEFFPNGTFTRYYVPIYDGRTSFMGHVFDGNV